MGNFPSFSRIREGMAAAWPICLGYVPIGLAFGVLAHHALPAMFICLLVFQIRGRLYALVAVLSGLLAGTVVVGMALFWLTGRLVA